MTNHIHNFFYPPTITYFYPMPKDKVIEIVQEIFHKPKAFMDGNDLEGRFVANDKFEIRTYTARNEYILEARIYETKDGTTEIITQLKPDLLWRFLFFVSAITIVVPIVIIATTNIGEGSIRSRYNFYIDKVLAKK